MAKNNPIYTDERWGGYIPWFFRHQNFSGTGNFQTFFSRLSQRLERLIKFNEPNIPNLLHFGAKLETESLQRFQESREQPYPGPIHEQLERFFNPDRTHYIKIIERVGVLEALLRILPEHPASMEP